MFECTNVSLIHDYRRVDATYNAIIAYMTISPRAKATPPPPQPSAHSSQHQPPGHVHAWYRCLQGMKLPSLAPGSIR